MMVVSMSVALSSGDFNAFNTVSTSADVVSGSVVGTNPPIRFSHSLVHWCVGRCSLIDGLVSGVPSDWLKSCRPLNNSCSKILSDSVTSVSVSLSEGTKTLSSWEISFGFRMGPSLDLCGLNGS